MKQLDLVNWDVVPLETKDAEQINGGWWQFFVGYVLMQALVSPQAHIDAFVDGIKQGYNATATQ